MTDKISNKTKKGFTLIELMIAIALIIMFSGLTLPVGFNFYQESTLNDQARNLENSLRRAQAMAMTGRGESNAGVKIEEGQYTIFEGESFGERRGEADIIIPFPIALSTSGIDEIVFQKLTGLPLPTFSEEERSIIIIFGANSQEITINSQGKIERHEKNGE
ncbi:MAG TPA: type II secretion system protein [Candidatus Humimicrobiaceae bacterium]|nr:type II secretion system protein [Candidatus Humimicrobiaceae bacterium]